MFASIWALIKGLGLFSIAVVVGLFLIIGLPIAVVAFIGFVFVVVGWYVSRVPPRKHFPEDD